MNQQEISEKYIELNSPNKIYETIQEISTQQKNKIKDLRAEN